MAEQEQEKVVIDASKLGPKQRHELAKKAAKERAALLRGEYMQIANSAALKDLVAKMHGFRDYHRQIGNDALGVAESPDGKAQTVKLNGEERLREYDKAAGIQEIIDYAERMLSDEPIANTTQ